MPVVQGRAVGFPVEVRRASSWAAMFAVPADAAQALVEQTGLRVAEPFPRRVIVTLAFVRYEDSDLDAYDEVAVNVMVRPHEGPAGRGPGQLARARAYVHQLPVNRSFTLEAGRQIWGYPKFLADIAIDRAGTWRTCSLLDEGTHVLTLAIRERGVFGVPARVTPTYSFGDGTLRLTPWEMQGSPRARLGGARLVLGDHPIADDLRVLGLPRRALATVRVPDVRARFGAPEVVRAPAATA